MKKVIGLTGGVASGKSTVSRFLIRLGANIINVDKIGHDLLLRDDVISLVKEAFPSTYVDGFISRDILGAIVFEDMEKLKILNDIMYPRMREVVTQSLIEGVNIIDMAILFESGFDDLCEDVVVVNTSMETQIARMEVRGYSEEKITGILNAQMDPRDKARRASFVINNDESIEKLKRKVDSLYKYLLEN